MKLISGIVRPEKVDVIRTALSKVNLLALTMTHNISNGQREAS